MGARVLWRPRANLDLANTALYLASHSAPNALRFVDAVQKATALLESHPFAGATVASLCYGDSEYRRWAIPKFRKYLLIYRATPHEVVIVRLLHGSRQLTPELFDEVADEL